MRSGFAWSAKAGARRSDVSEERKGPFPEDLRKDIFAALVEAQDRATSVAQSRQQVAQRFGVTEAHVREIEAEGLDREWPPL